MNMTSLTCKFLRSYTEFWQRCLWVFFLLRVSLLLQHRECHRSIKFFTTFIYIFHLLLTLWNGCFCFLSVCFFCFFFPSKSELPRLLSDSLAVFHFHLVMEWMMILRALNHYPPPRPAWNVMKPPIPSFVLVIHTLLLLCPVHWLQTLFKSINYILWQHIERD